MNPNSKRIIKWIVIRLLIVSLIVFGFIMYGLNLLDVEDRYGDLQDLYWNSRDGDIIVNRFNSKIGIVKLDWHRIYIKKGTKLMDADEWLDPEKKNKYRVAIYRPKTKIDMLNNLNLSDVSRFKLIAEIVVEY